MRGDRRRRMGASLATTGLVVGLVALTTTGAVRHFGEQSAGMMTRVAAATNAVSGAVDGNGPPAHDGTLPVAQAVAEFDPVSFQVVGFSDPEGDRIGYDLAITGELQPGDLALTRVQGGVQIAGVPSGTGTVSVRASDALGRSVVAGPVEIAVSANGAPVVATLVTDTVHGRAGVPLGPLDLASASDPETDGLSAQVLGLGAFDGQLIPDAGAMPVSLAGTPGQAGRVEVTVAFTDQHGAQAHSAVIGIEIDRAIDGTSCKAILDAGEGRGDGVYVLDPDGIGGVKAYEAWCDMTSAGGGWTLVAAAFDSDPFLAWNEGMDSGYDPTLATRQSFGLSDAQIPPHAQVGFGRDHDANFVDATTVGSGFTYTAGDIPRTLVTGLSGATYHVHRDSVAHYQNQDPEALLTPHATAYSQSLTFDGTGGMGLDWSFAPRRGYLGSNGTIETRGYAQNGVSYTTTQDPFGWTVWVR